MKGDDITSDLLTRINSNITNENGGNKTMANLKDMQRQQAEKKKADEAAKAAEAAKATEGADTTPEKTDGDTGTAPEANGEDKKKALADLIHKANAENNADAGLNQTNEFANNGEDATSMTPEEIEKARKAQERKAEMARRVQDHNATIESNRTQLKSLTKDIEITPEQKTYQSACFHSGHHVGFLMETGAEPKLAPKIKFQTRDKELVVRPGSDEARVAAFKVAQKKTNVEKRALFEYGVGLNFTYAKPKNMFGSIICLPQILNINITSLTRGDFPTPTTEEINASPRVFLSYDPEGFFTILTAAFGGKMRESKAVHATKALVTGAAHVLEGNFKTKKIKVDNSYTGETVNVKEIISHGHKQLFIKENVIPYRVAQTVTLAEIAANRAEDTKVWANNSFVKFLEGSADKDVAFKYLEENVKGILSGTIEGNSVLNFTNKLLTGEVKAGDGLAKDVVLYDWSDVVKDATGKSSAAIAVPAMVKKVGTRSTSDPTKTIYKNAYKVLGVDLTLAELAAMGYTAVNELLGDKSFDVSTITALYTAYKADLKMKKDAKASNQSTASGRQVRQNTTVDADMTIKLVMASLKGTGLGAGIEYDSKSAQDSIIKSSYVGVRD